MSQPASDPLDTALAHHRAGDLPLAEQLYRQILARHPEIAGAWHLLGTLCMQSGRDAEAIELIGRAIELNPSDPNFYNHLGVAYGKLDQLDAAITTLRRAVQLAPGVASFHYNLGTVLRDAKRFDESVLSFRHSLAARPDSPETHFNLANTLRDMQRYDEAEASLREAIRLRPAYVKALINLGSLLCERERSAEAVEILRQAVAADARHANAHLNLGTALRDAGRYEEAVAALRRAVELDPASAEARNNLGTSLQALARYDEARACYEEALRLDPQLADAHFSRATDLMRQGDIARGFAEYEWRWKCKNYSWRTFSQPRWDGTPLAGRTILLHAEQGLGDTLQFVRYAQRVKSGGGTVIVECHPPLLPLLKSCAGIDQLVPMDGLHPPFDAECPLLSLPGVLKLLNESLWSGAYLFAEPARVQRWRERLAAVIGYRVGVCWQGNKKHMFDRQRSFPLASFAPLAAVEGVRLVSLQKGEGSEQLAEVDFEVVDLGAELDADGAFLDTAAVIANLDLVITTDTAIAHLAGALGASVWLPLSLHCDWRWQTDRADSPWYPTMRLVRQSRLDQWDDVFRTMAYRLREVITGRS